MSRCVVIVPILNRLEYVKKSLPTILDQDYPELTVVLWDNGSGQATAEYLRATAEDHYTPHRVALVRSPWNTGVVFPQSVIWTQYSESNSFLAKMDSDCLFPPDMITRLAKAAGSHKKLGVMGGFHFGFGAHKWINHRKRTKEFEGQQVVVQKVVSGCACLVRNDVLFNHGPVGAKVEGRREPFLDTNFSRWQNKLSARGMVNGYPLPLVHVEQMEDTRSKHFVNSNEHRRYKRAMRNTTPERQTQRDWIDFAKKALG